MVESEISGATDYFKCPPSSSGMVTEVSSTRSTKPGSTRLVVTLSVLISFFLAFPFFYASTAIYRSPLPFAAIASLSSSVLSRSTPLPCRLRVIFVVSNPDPSKTERLHGLIADDVRSRVAEGASCGECGHNVDVKVYEDLEERFCGVDGEDEHVDELLESVLEIDEGGLGRIYTVVLVQREKPTRTVVGKHRHAWVIGRFTEREAIDLVGGVFVKYFVNGGREIDDGGVREGEFAPVGLDGNLVLSFSLLNADPNDWIYDWDFHEMKLILDPLLEALVPVANISIESQVLYHTPKSFSSYWDKTLESYIFNTKDLPFFVNSNEWHLDTSIATGGRAKVLQFVVYIPSASECPLWLQLPNGEISASNGFASPMWGGVVVENPANCSSITHMRNTFTSQDVEKILGVFVAQLRVLFGFRSSNEPDARIGVSRFLNSRRGFSERELDLLYRRHTCLNLMSCVSTLNSLSKLVQSLPRMIVTDEIGRQVELSLASAATAQNSASLGVYDASAESSRSARALAEDAFFHPSIMSISYSSKEHYFAIYMPFFAPAMLHVLLAAGKEVKRYVRKRKKYLASL